MRLHLANPNSTEAMTRIIAGAARAVAASGTEIVASTARGGPPSIEGHHDGALAVPWLLAEIARTEAEGAHAHIIACFDDTGIDAARAASAVPVIGIGEAACLLATQLAESFVIVTSADISVPVLRANLRRSELAERCADVCAAGVGVLRIEDQGGDPVARAVRRAAEEFPAAALVLGCAGMAEFASRLSAELGRPVIDGVAAAVVLAEGAVRLGLPPNKAGGWRLPERAG